MDMKTRLMNKMYRYILDQEVDCDIIGKDVKSEKDYNFYTFDCIAFKGGNTLNGLLNVLSGAVEFPIVKFENVMVKVKHNDKKAEFFPIEESVKNSVIVSDKFKSTKDGSIYYKYFQFEQLSVDDENYLPSSLDNSEISIIEAAVLKAIDKSLQS